MCCGTICSCQSATTSETAKHFSGFASLLQWQWQWSWLGNGMLPPWWARNCNVISHMQITITYLLPSRGRLACGIILYLPMYSGGLVICSPTASVLQQENYTRCAQITCGSNAHCLPWGLDLNWMRCNFVNVLGA